MKTGITEVILEVSETEKTPIPNLVKFGCGVSVLLTIPAPPPLYLRYSSVGHMRWDCQMQGLFFSVAPVAREARLVEAQVENQMEDLVSSHDEQEVGSEANGKRRVWKNRQRVWQKKMAMWE